MKIFFSSTQPSTLAQTLTGKKDQAWYIKAERRETQLPETRLTVIELFIIQKSFNT